MSKVYMRCHCATMWQTLYAIFAIHISLLDCNAFNSIGLKRTIRESLILHCAKPYIEFFLLHMRADFGLQGKYLA